MGSEQNDSTSVPPSEPKLCANGCGFFGSPSNMNLCSKCHRNLCAKEDRAANAKAVYENSFKPVKSQPQGTQQEPHEDAEAVATHSSSAVVAAVAASAATAVAVGSVSGAGDQREPPRPNRCFSCNKKVGLTGFKCKCGSTFCGVHRYPEKHECNFDFKETGREVIAKANPLVKADKLQRI